MATFRTFQNGQAARDYRHANGTGGWIFVSDADGSAILFPPNMSPSGIFNHEMTRGKSGRLIGSA